MLSHSFLALQPILGRDRAWDASKRSFEASGHEFLADLSDGAQRGKGVWGQEESFLLNEDLHQGGSFNVTIIVNQSIYGAQSLALPLGGECEDSNPRLHLCDSQCALHHIDCQLKNPQLMCRDGSMGYLRF